MLLATAAFAAFAAFYPFSAESFEIIVVKNAELKPYEEVLRGVRGEPPYDIEATAELLVRLSQLLADYPTIQEIDINPVMVFQSAGGAQALDARVILKKDH